jgi:hypothetical protein
MFVILQPVVKQTLSASVATQPTSTLTAATSQHITFAPPHYHQSHVHKDKHNRIGIVIVHRMVVAAFSLAGCPCLGGVYAPTPCRIYPPLAAIFL